MEKDLRSQDDILITQFCQGDNDAFGVLFNRWKTEFYFFAYSYAKNEQDAEDILHDCFEKIIKKSVSYRQEKFQNEGVSFKAYLFKVIKNRALDILRVKSNRCRIIDEWFVSQQQISENFAFVKGRDLVAEKILQTLKKRERAIFVMYMDGFTLDEIGERYQVSKKTVSNVLSASKEKLRVIWIKNNPAAGS
jgi:RNA polymerase sigma-70 factor (ECF subfamily)